MKLPGDETGNSYTVSRLLLVGHNLDRRFCRVGLAIHNGSYPNYQRHVERANFALGERQS